MAETISDLIIISGVSRPLSSSMPNSGCLAAAFGRFSSSAWQQHRQPPSDAAVAHLTVSGCFSAHAGNRCEFGVAKSPVERVPCPWPGYCFPAQAISVRPDPLVNEQGMVSTGFVLRCERNHIASKTIRHIKALSRQEHGDVTFNQVFGFWHPFQLARCKPGGCFLSRHRLVRNDRFQRC